MDSNSLFLSKYDFEFYVNDKKFDLTTDDIKTFTKSRLKNTLCTKIY